MVGVVAVGSLPNCSIEQPQQLQPIDSRLGNTHLKTPDLCTSRSIDSPQSGSQRSAPHHLPFDKLNQDPCSNNPDSQIVKNNSNLNHVVKLCDLFDDDRNNVNGNRDSDSRIQELEVHISSSDDSGLNPSKNDKDSYSYSDNISSNDDDVHSYSIPSYTCEGQALRINKGSHDILEFSTCNPEFDSSLHNLLHFDDCDESYKCSDHQRLGQKSEHSKDIATKAKWSTNPIWIYCVEPRLLPNLWKIYTTPTTSTEICPAIFRRQYSQKCDAADVTQTPLVLSTMRKSSKVYASMIRLDPDRDGFKEVGPQIVIPVNYPGWFQHIENNNVMVHSLPTIGDVARAELSEFVVHRAITAFRYAERSDEGEKLYAEVAVPAGEVLTTRSVLTEWLSSESVHKGCFCARRRKPKTDASFLKVRDSNSRRLLIPFEIEGGFSGVGQRGGETKYDVSYQLTDIARWVQMPVELKLVCGQLPEGLEQNTGLFRLEQLSFESSIYGCTKGISADKEHEMVEFPVDTGMEFVQCNNWADMRDTTGVQSALLQCQQNMEDFVTSMKVVKDVDAEDEFSLDNETFENIGKATVERSLPPTPLLPHSVRPRKLKGWSWAKRLLTRYRRPHISRDRASSENSDYEVIPFYLRTVNRQEEQDLNAKICESLERTNFAQFNSALDLSEKDIESIPPDCSTLPSSSPPPPKFKVRGNREPRADGAHDEDGYLLPVEVRDVLKENMLSTPQSPHHGKNASTSFYSVGLDTSSSATITRELDTNVGSLNKSTETLLAPPSSGTARTFINCASESEHSPGTFDQQRLDAFLSDSIHELRRRQSRELLTQITEMVEQKQQKSCHACAAPTVREQMPVVHNQDDVNTFLDKIFDYDKMSDDKGPSSHSGSTTTGNQTRRSMSVPESMLPRLDHMHRGSRQCLECGYQTLDSGIWLSPRSGLSDPYRQDRDSATYRSTSDCSWVPPENIEQLTVEEVGLSLRYIGMKDYIVTRFCEEQIDGKQLTELTSELLLEGFPDLNALDRKKLSDFVLGWRPKKWGYVPAE